MKVRSCGPRRARLALDWLDGKSRFQHHGSSSERPFADAAAAACRCRRRCHCPEPACGLPTITVHLCLQFGKYLVEKQRPEWSDQYVGAFGMRRCVA